ncbi:unnamed protein product [Mytilus edulis]|uniref:Fibrinogen C-terminal domain-containing protein n=1 Tax=Mytilus edulis TaxID=6550 RepID=A0A8S3S3H5_MYTED|nr:unnamed protein product [Mytilus edulis]
MQHNQEEIIMLTILIYGFTLCVLVLSDTPNSSDDVEVQLLDNQNAPLVATLDMSKANKRVKQFVSDTIEAKMKNIEDTVKSKQFVSDALEEKIKTIENTVKSKQFVSDALEAKMKTIEDTVKSEQFLSNAVEAKMKDLEVNLQSQMAYFERNLTDQLTEYINEIVGKIDGENEKSIKRPLDCKDVKTKKETESTRYIQIIQNLDLTSTVIMRLTTAAGRSTGLRILNGRHKDGLANDYTFCGSRGMIVVDYLLAPYYFLHIIDQFIVCNFTSYSDHAALHVRLRCILHDSQEPERNSGTSNNSYNSYRWKEELKDQCYESLTLNSSSLSQIVFSDIEKSQDGIDNYVESFTSNLMDIISPFFCNSHNSNNTCDRKFKIFDHFRTLVTNDGINLTVDTPETVSDTTYDELDKIITQDEILKCISNLKRGKNHGIDGNRKINKLTSQGKYELRVDMSDFNGNKLFAKYSSFLVGNVTTKYKLKVGGYSGNSGDSMTYSNGMSFSTKDRDNDLWSPNCAVNRYGAWWYKDCTFANLNGRYAKGDNNGLLDVDAQNSQSSYPLLKFHCYS